MSLRTSTIEPSQTAPVASVPAPLASTFAPVASLPAPVVHSCHCTSTGEIVGITLAAASTASVFTMLVLLCLLRRNGRSASTKFAGPMTEPFFKSKHLTPSPSSIRDTVILISPGREAPLMPVDAEMRRSSESHYSQDSRHRDRNVNSGLRLSVPQLPTIDLSPSNLAVSPYSLESEYRSKNSASNLSPPPPPAPSRSYIYEGPEDFPSSGRTPSIIGSFAGSDRRGAPSMTEGVRSKDRAVDVRMKMKPKMSLEASGAAPPRMLPVNASRTAALLPLGGRSR